ncbi:MAG: amino acid permease [Paludibacter sp.]|jgi:amino acid transporter/archaellum biogenesis ATPase FlaH|nr:amino acid permease [Paludibacter sp.]
MAKARKFGAFGGVFTPSILTILGVIMYLRLPWIVGQAGFFATLGIIILAHIISASTGLSVASIATDKKVESGGTYYIISRSLGLPIGGTLGWALFVGLSFSVSLYLIGFSEVFLGYFGFDVTLNNIRIAGVIILLIITVLTFISTSLAIKTQYLILTAMVLSLVSLFLGQHTYAPAALQTGTLPDSLPWIALFAIFFPAVTGFEAGVSMSGDLRDPKRAIPTGTISAILVGLVVYIGLAYYFSATVDRTVLVNDTNVLLNISWLPQLVVAGILGATFSSALGSILSAPRILQAVAKDRIAPRFFSKGHGPSNEPRNAILLTFLIALGGILIGELNVIARVVTTFFIIIYGFLNITYTVESWASSDFRPSFRIPRFVSIVGALAAVVIMIQLDVLAMIGASIILVGLFLVLRRQELNLQSGDTWNSVWMSIVKHGLKKLTRNEVNNRNWRPNIILMSGGATTRPHLIQMALSMIGRQGVFTNFELEENANPGASPAERVRVEKLSDYPEIITRKYNCSSIYEGIDMISRVYGFSGFEPDTILMGWPKATANPERMEKLLATLSKRDFTLALLDYDPERGFGDYASVDFWWNGSGRELSLALHLFRFISSRKEWRKARLRLLVLNRDVTLTERYYSILNQLVNEYRVNAEVKVVMNLEKKPPVDLISIESESTGLTMLALSEPGMNADSSLIDNADALSSRLHSCLWLSASQRFEQFDVLPDSSNGEDYILENDQEKIGSLLELPANSCDAKELTEFAQKEDADLEVLCQELFTVLEHRRFALADALLSRASSPVGWLHLIDNQLNDELAFEEDLMGVKVTAFLSSLKNNLTQLLKQLHLKPGRKDPKALDAAVTYFLFSRRIDSMEHFYSAFLVHTLEFTVSLRELLILTLTEKDFVDRKEALKELIQAHFRAIQHSLVIDFRKDILLLSQLLESTELTAQYSGWKKLIVEKERKLIELEEAPAHIRRFIQFQWNKTKLEGICLKTREEVKVASQQLTEDVKRQLQATLYKSLGDLLSSLSEKKNTANIQVNSELPAVESFFQIINNQLRELVDELPESILVAGNQLPEVLSVEKVEEAETIEINVRTIINYYISNELVDRLNKLSVSFTKGVQRVAIAIGNITKLVNYHQALLQDAKPSEMRVLDDLKVNIEKEMERLEALESRLQKDIDSAMYKAFEALNAVEILNAAGRPGARILPRHQQHKAQKRFYQMLAVSRQKLVQAWVSLFYHQSKGILWTKRQELVSERASLYPGDSIKQYVERHSAEPKILDQLPYYYVGLFSDDAGAAQEFRVPMPEESSLGDKAVRRFMEGYSGILIITGDRGSGKSSLARYLIENHFGKDQVWRVRAPLGCSADVQEFDNQLKKQVGGKGSLERQLDGMKGKNVVLVDDLELWWERRPGGTRVVERIVELNRLYENRLLIIVTINRYALKVLEQLTKLNSRVSELIFCQPFNAGELKEMILTRHQAGGMSFVLDNREEDEFSNWAYARYFNQLFNCTGGNPGLAAQRWLSGIQTVNGMVIGIQHPLNEELILKGQLSDDEWLLILQFVIHRRFWISQLSRILHWNVERIDGMIRQLVRNGVLRETTSGVYSIQALLEPLLIDQLKKIAYI